jgi:hypothetical protein
MPRDWRRAAHVYVPSTFLAVCAVAALAQQQQPQIGMAPVAIGPGPYTFDTAEQHRLRVVVQGAGPSVQPPSFQMDEDDGALLRLEPTP